MCPSWGSSSRDNIDRRNHPIMWSAKHNIREEWPAAVTGFFEISAQQLRLFGSSWRLGEKTNPSPKAKAVRT
jgi:hypothetical protein